MVSAYVLALLFILSPSRAGTISITFDGEMVDWQGKSIYDNQMEGSLDNPTPFNVEFRIPEGTTDSDSSSLRGVYTSQSTSVTFSFGPFEETHYGVTVEVWSGYLVGGQAMWGFMLRNANACSAYSVYRPSSQGIYGFFVTAFNYQGSGGPDLCPNDSLSNIIDAQSEYYFYLFNGNKHFYHDGTAGYPPVTVHAEADNVISNYTAVVE